MVGEKEIASPYLHVQTILERMKRAYDLELRSDESLPMLDQEAGRCRTSFLFAKGFMANAEYATSLCRKKSTFGLIAIVVSRELETRMGIEQRANSSTTLDIGSLRAGWQPSHAIE